MSSRTVAVARAQALSRGALCQGIDLDPLLRRAGIPPRLMADPRARLTFEQYTRLVQELWAATGDEYVGLYLARGTPGTFVTMCRFAIHGRDLEHAMRRAFRFYGLFPIGPRLRLLREGPTARVTLDLQGAEDPDSFLSDVVMLVWHRLCDWAIGRRFPLAEIRFPSKAPHDAADIAVSFGCPVVFEADRPEARFDSELLSAPIVREEADLTDYLRDTPAGLLVRPDHGATVAERVRRMLEHGLRSGGLPSCDEVAERLAVSPATLRRRLGEHGRSFRDLREEVLRDAAIVALVEGGEPIDRLAERLGFSETSAFRRAFKRWTGSGPAAYLRAPRSREAGRPRTTMAPLET